MIVGSTAPAAADELEDLRRDLARVREEVAAVRGLEWKREVAVEVAKERPANERWAGYYRSGSDTITVVDPAEVGLDLLLAHELTHALQDQWFDLRQIDRGARDGDRRLAVQAAIEGEAHLVAAAVLLRRLGLDGRLPAEDLPAVRLIGYGLLDLRRLVRPRTDSGVALPPARRDEFLFPYVEGLAFAQAVARARGRGLRGLDGVLLDPPRSTEQVLHPEKYLATPRDDPARVPVPPPGAPGRWRLAGSSTRGEWRIRALLSERLPPSRARRAAAGWAGDAFAEYEASDTPASSNAPPAGRHSVWATVWDTDADAREFAAAAREGVPGAKVDVSGREVTVYVGWREPSLY